MQISNGVKKEIAIIGLGKMGKNMTLRLLEKKWKVVVYDKDKKPKIELAKEGVIPADSLADLEKELTFPRLVWLMVPAFAPASAKASAGKKASAFGRRSRLRPTKSAGKPAGKPVDEVIFQREGLMNFLEKGDIIIDGGNSFYQDSIKRAKKLQERGIEFLDVGVSGGPGGARKGACLMIGGKKKIYEKLKPLFKDLATENGYQYLGKSGAGHFVKMVHNGIEYGMMQAIAEGFNLMKNSPFKLDLKRIAHLYNHGSVIQSRLIGWLEKAFKEHGQDLKEVSGKVEATGEGEWTIKVAKKWKIPVKVIEDSFLFRVQSKKKPTYTGKILSALREQFGHHKVTKI